MLIARAVPTPTPAVRPALRQAAAAPQAAPQPAPPRLVEPIRAAVAPASASYEPPIRMARVRTVPLGQSSVATAPPAPSQPRYQAASVAQPAAEEPRQFVVPDQGRGARPSTLDAQARRLDGGQPAVYAGQQTATGSTTLAAAQQTYSAPSYAGAVSGDFAVQVGAFPSAAEAQARLREVRQSAGSLLAAATDTTEPIAQGSRTLYRARFSGLEAGPAAQTCTALRRQRVECFVTRLR